MAKKSLVLGFTKSIESAPGVWTKKKVETPYRADVLTYNKQYASNEGVNDDIQFRNRYSIVMRDMAQYYEDIKYVKIGLKKWKVTALEFLPPRIILTVGGEYHAG